MHARNVQLCITQVEKLDFNSIQQIKFKIYGPTRQWTTQLNQRSHPHFHNHAFPMFIITPSHDHHYITSHNFTMPRSPDVTSGASTKSYSSFISELTDRWVFSCFSCFSSWRLEGSEFQGWVPSLRSSVGLGSSVGWTPAGLTYVFAKGVSDQVRDPLTPRNSLQ